MAGTAPTEGQDTGDTIELDRCVAALARLRATVDAGPVGSGAVPAARTVLRELRRTRTGRGDGRGSSVETLFARRLVRLTAGAEEIAAAAAAGDRAALRGHVYRFHALATATWRLRLALPGPGDHRRPAPGPSAMNGRRAAS